MVKKDVSNFVFRGSSRFVDIQWGFSVMENAHLGAKMRVTDKKKREGKKTERKTEFWNLK